MIRTLLIATGAAALLGACTVTTVSDPYYSRGSYYNPPGWIDRDRDGRDDRVQRDRYYSSGYYSSGYNTGYQGGYYDRWGNWHSYR